MSVVAPLVALALAVKSGRRRTPPTVPARFPCPDCGRRVMPRSVEFRSNERICPRCRLPWSTEHDNETPSTPPFRHRSTPLHP